MGNKRSLVKWAIIAAILTTVPLYGGTYVLSLINLAAIAVIGAIGLNILTGYTGQISLGHAAFMGVGAYVAGYLTTNYNIPFLLAVLCAGLASSLAGLIFGSPSLRLKGLYLAMATLASQILLEYLFKNLRSVTGGVSGLYIKSPSIFGFSFGTDQRFYFIAIGLALLAIWTASNLFKTKTGRAFIAIRDRDIAAEIIGINSFKYKLISFAISSFYAGVAGSLLGFYMTIVAPESFQLAVSIQYVAMVIIGGPGTIAGAVYGAIFVTLLPQGLEYITNIMAQFYPMEAAFAAIRDMTFGLLIILFLLFEPKGLSDIIPKMGRWLRGLIFKKGVSLGS